MSDREWDGGFGEGPRQYYVLEWSTAAGKVRGWGSHELSMVLAKRADVIARLDTAGSRVLSVSALSLAHVIEAWTAGAFEGKDRDLNYGTREGHAKGVESFSTIPV